MSVTFTIEFRSPADLVAQIREFTEMREREEMRNSRHARTVKDKHYHDGAAEALASIASFLEDLEIKEVK